MQASTSAAFILAFFASVLFSVSNLYAQENSDKAPKLVQITGLVVKGENLEGIPGVNVFSTTSGRGTTSNFYGYFSYPAKVNDTLTITAVGFKKQYYFVPDTNTIDISVVISLEEDTTLLPTVNILPYSTEELFKQAFLALDLQDHDAELRRMLNSETMREMAEKNKFDPSLAYTYYMNQRAQDQAQQYQIQTTEIINPFAWKRFIKDLKKEDKN